MRIISGFLKGRNISGYNIEGTRPTMDRIRESLFSIIQNDIESSIILDLFSGTGVLGLEAISNGSKYCYFNDLNNICVDNIKRLIKEFNIEDKCSITNLDYKKALSYYKDNNIKFNIVFLDPPYKMNFINEIINFIMKNNLLISNGLIICEVDNNYLDEFKDLKLIKNKKYGNKFIYIYKKTL